ncbi:MAG: Na+:solute symporter [Terrimicrobiaceae bacterium]
MTLEYLTLGIYLVVLLVLGTLFARLNRNLGDFVRAGARGSWWMVGTSICMSGISAFTFTGNGSAAFSAGPSLLVIYAANLLGFALGGLFLGPWFRQTRAYTGADVIRARFGTPVEQFSIYTGLLLGPLGAAIQLWALAVFVSAVFELPLMGTIIAVGAIVTLYSVTGGKWAVMATDVVQGIILYGITLMAGILALVHMGGITGLWELATSPAFADSFRLLKEPGQFPEDRFTLQWAVVVFCMQLMTQINLGTAGRYLSAKDGREAARASWWAFALIAVGSAVWFLPPMAARFFFEQEVLALKMDDPTTGAYAVAAMHFLPTGLMGIMIAAMFAATMSSMDSGINGLTGVVVHNLIGRIREKLARPPISERALVRLCRFVSATLGAVIITMSITIATRGNVDLFDTFLLMGAVIGTPIVLPLLAGLFLRKLPAWSYFLIFGLSMLPTLYIEIAVRNWEATPWSIQERGMWVLLFGLAGTALSRLCAPLRSKAQIAREEAFFETMHRPVDFENEVGEANDSNQAKMVGGVTLAIGVIMLLLLLVPNGLSERLLILALCLFTAGCGGLLLLAGIRAGSAQIRNKK